MALKTNYNDYRKTNKRKRPGRHSKKRTSSHKAARHYKKTYRGQGR